MSRDVFISYSSKDRSIADSLCAALEAGGMSTWIAPRDIAPGAQYGAAIIGALDACRMMVLVFSAHSNASPQVAREVERAVSKGLEIVPFRIEAAPLSKAMEYFISAAHWLDAWTPPLEKHLEYLVQAVRAKLNAPGDGMAAKPIGAVMMVSERVEPQHFADHADVRFSISNLSDRAQQVAALELRIIERREIDVLRLKKAGAMIQEFRLSQRIEADRDVYDLFADLEAQEILEPRGSDAFRLKLEGAQGTQYTCRITARFVDVASGESREVAGPSFEVQYPIRSMDVLRGRRKSQ